MISTKEYMRAYYKRTRGSMLKGMGVSSCKKCGKKFTKNSNSQKYCSDKCNRLSFRDRKNLNKIVVEKNCKFCHNVFHPINSRNVFCSLRCESVSNSLIHSQRKYRSKYTPISTETITCKNCNREIVKIHKNHKFCSISCRTKFEYKNNFDYRKKRNDQSRKWMLSNPEKRKSIAKESRKRRIDEYRPRMNFLASENRKNLSDGYVKQKLRRSGALPVPELVQLKRKTIKLKRLSNEYKQAIENQNTGRNGDDAGQGNRIYETIRPERPIQYETNQLNPANG